MWSEQLDEAAQMKRYHHFPALSFGEGISASTQMDMQCVLLPVEHLFAVDVEDVGLAANYPLEVEVHSAPPPQTPFQL